MKKSEFKKYLKTEILKMSEATAEDVKNQKEYNAELEKTKELENSMNENKITKSAFKEYLKQEILREINEQEEDLEIDAEEFDFDEPGFNPTGEQDIDDITDSLVDLARKAKEVGQVELANQILNSAKFSSKTQFKDVEKEA